MIGFEVRISGYFGKALGLRRGKVKKILSQVWKDEQELREDEVIQYKERGLFRAPQVFW